MKIEAEGQELVIRNDKGDVAIIPKTHRSKALKHLEEGDHSALDKLIESLPLMDDYAEDGTLVTGDPPDKTTIKTPVVQKLENVTTYPSDWINNPITQEKLEKISSGLGASLSKELKRINVVDMQQFQSDDIYKKVTQDIIDDMSVIGKSRKLAALKIIKAKSHNRSIGGTSQLRGSDYIGGRITNAENPDEKGIFSHEVAHNKYQYVIENFITKNFGDKRLTDEQGAKALKATLDPTKTYDNFDYVLRQNRSEDEGIYPRIMELRKITNKHPGDIWTPEDLEDPKINFLGSPLQGLKSNYDTETLIEILNTVAEANNKKNNSFAV